MRWGTETKLGILKDSPLNTQVDGDHYKKYPIQPAEFLHKNNIPFLEGTAIKYIVRHRDKGKVVDIDKAIHILQMIKEMTYSK